METVLQNIVVVNGLAATVRSTLGPSGAHKLFINGSSPSLIVSNDGATILHELSVQVALHDS
jgi:archaeal chaperonin